MNDLKFAFRQLLRSPGFSFVAILTLALGIGANAAIVTMIQAVVFKPISASRPDRLVGIYQHEVNNTGNFQFFSFPDFQELREDKSVWKDLSLFNHAQVAIREENFVRQSVAHIVSANYFSTLGAVPILGRAFLSEEESKAADSVILSYAYWQRMGGRPDIVGSELKLAQGNFTIVGVMPPSFSGVNATSPTLYFPTGATEILWSQPGKPTRALTDRGEHVFMAFARLQDGFSRKSADERLKVLSEKHRFGDPRDSKGRDLIATDLARFNYSNSPSQFVKKVIPIASFALALSISVLAVACLNLANMLLARGTARRKEIAVRLAIGASRKRILRQLLCEGFLLAILGGIGGIVIAIWSTSSIAAVINNGVGADMFKVSIIPDLPILAALFGICSLATLLFALGPAWKLASMDVNQDLKQHGAAEVDRKLGRVGVKSLLVVGQLALSLALLVAAGLFARSAVAAMQADPGFQYGSHFIARIDTGIVNYEKTRAIDIFNEAEQRLAILPGVESVSSALFIPFGQEGWTRDVQLGGAPKTGPDNATRSLKDGKALQVAYNVVGADYFRTLGIPLLRGRDFLRSESESKPPFPVAIITQDIARKLFGDLDPVGRTIQFPNGDNPTVMQVVGVAPPILWDLFFKNDVGMVMTPRGQDFQSSMKVHVRVMPNADPRAVMDLVRKTLHDIDPQIPLIEMKPLKLIRNESMSVRMTQIGALLFGAFGVVAMLLSFLGVYGLKAYAVARRTREIGIRMALGATARDVFRMIVGEGARLAVVGLLLGLGLAFGVGKMTGRFLYGVNGLDPLTFSIIPIALAAVTLIACWLPARRATRVNPMTALRCE